MPEPGGRLLRTLWGFEKLETEADGGGVGDRPSWTVAKGIPRDEQGYGRKTSDGESRRGAWRRESKYDIRVSSGV